MGVDVDLLLALAVRAGSRNGARGACAGSGGPVQGAIRVGDCPFGKGPGPPELPLPHREFDVRRPGERTDGFRGIFELVNVVHAQGYATFLCISRVDGPSFTFAAIFISPTFSAAFTAAGGHEGDERRGDEHRENEASTRHDTGGWRRE